MAWKIPISDRIKYARNMIERAITQVRFAPILTIDKKVPEFQDTIRRTFPFYEEVRNYNVTASEGNLGMNHVNKAHRFISEDKHTVVSLTTDSLSVESFEYSRRRDFHESINAVVPVFAELYEHIQPRRAGLRFINKIDKGVIESDLGESLSWSELVQESFLNIPVGEADHDRIRTYNEMTTPLENGGMLTLRYGLLGKEKKSTIFYFDLDRYTDDEFDIMDYGNIIHDFGVDTSSLFNCLVTAKLKQWLEEETDV